MRPWPAARLPWVLLPLALGACASRPAPVDDDDATAPPPAAQPADLSALVEARRGAFNLPALGGAAVRGGSLVGIGTAGVRKVGDPSAVTNDDRFHLGSDTKAMTATLAARLVTEGRLSWDSTLAASFPALPEGMDPGWSAVTLTQLLQHRGGAPAVVPPAIWGPLFTDARPILKQRAAFVAELLKDPPEGVVGEFLYSNAGYMLAGAMLEAATGTSWEGLLTAELFVPLEMSGCGFGPPARPGTVDQPWGHSPGPNGPVPVDPGAVGADNPAALGPAGTVHCPLASWSRFVALHVAGARGESDFLPADAWSRLHTPPPGGDYAMGWLVTERAWAGGAVLTHNGSNRMNFATAWLAPQIDRAFLAVTNLGGEDAAAGCDALVAELIGEQ